MSQSLESALLLVISLGCFWLIASPSIKTGVFITAGLWLLLTGNVANIDPTSLSERSYELRVWGVIFILWGCVWRFLIRGFWLRLSTKWHAAHAGARWFGIEKRRFPRSDDHANERSDRGPEASTSRREGDASG